MKQPSPGSHIVTRIWWKASGKSIPACYTHHGIYLGDAEWEDKVVRGAVRHWASGDQSNPSVKDAAQRKRNSTIRVDPLDAFCGGLRWWVREYPGSESDPVSVVLSRAADQWKWYLAEYGPYHFLHNNCEHFATWCITGKRHCSQAAAAKRNLVATGSKVTAQTVLKRTARAASSASVKTLGKTVTPWAIVADGMQLVTEHLAGYGGMPPQSAKRVGQGVGFLGSVGIGAICGGPLGAAVGLGTWLLGELMGEAVAG